jgi:Trypsin-co-occurring domain 1
VTQLASFDLAEGGSVLVEIEPLSGATLVGRQGDVLRAVGQTFDDAIGRVRDAATAALGQFTSMAKCPDEVEIKFGVKLDAEVGAVIARTGVTGQFEVKLTWRAPTPDTKDDLAGAVTT